MQRSPVIYLAFANHSTNPLPNLAREGRVLLQTLAPRGQAGDFNVHRDELIILPVLADYLRRYKDQIVLFHFAGHAHASALIFLEQKAIGTGIAELLAQQTNLKLVFLNGCSTQAQVTLLLDLGIPAVIATACSVGDDTASTFAEHFYDALARDFTIQKAFDHAAAYLKTAGQTINFSRELRPREAVDTNHWGLFARDEAALNWKLPSKNAPTWLPPWMNKLWVKIITCGLVVFLLLVQLLNNITEIPTDGQTARDNYFKGSESPPVSVAESCGFPTEFRDDSLYILITRFEDYISKNEADCFGMALMRRIDAKKMPIRICYIEKLMPRQRREVKAIQEQYHADLVLWGNLKNLAQGCSEGDICFRSQPSDTIVKICGGEIAPEKADLDYESRVSPEDIELGSLHVGEKTFDAWLTGIFNAKVGKKKPDFFVVDESLSKLEQAKLWNEKGDLFHDIELYFKAIRCYTKSLEINPAGALAYFKRGNAKGYLKNYKEAIADFSKAIQIDSNYASAYNNRGIAKSDLKDYKGAIADYSKAIQIDPKSASAYSNRGRAKASLKNYKGAIADFSKVIQLDPRIAEGYFFRGWIKYDLNDFHGAIDDVSKAIFLDPKDDECYLLRGINKYALEDFHGAIDDYSKAILLDPKDGDHYFQRGQAKFALSDFSGAIDDYSKTVLLEPRAAFTYSRRGDAKLSLKNYKGAIDDHSKAIQLNPNIASAYHNRGIAKSNLKDHKGAIADYSKAIQLDPKDAQIYFFRGITKENLKNYKGAIDDYSKAIQLDPKYAYAYLNRGGAKYKLKYYKDAIDDCSYAIKLNPNYAKAYYNRSKCFRDVGDIKRAILDFKKGLSLNWKLMIPTFFWTIFFLFSLIVGFKESSFYTRIKNILRAGFTSSQKK